MKLQMFLEAPGLPTTKRKNKNKDIEDREELGYAMIDWSHFDDKSASKIRFVL